MTREFPDELLSAYLDNELSASERAQVERQLDANALDRQLLEELKSLRNELGALPQVAVTPDFADRVVRAVIAEADQHDDAATTVSTPSAGRAGWQWKVGAAVASAAALAVCLLLVFLSRRSGTTPPGEIVKNEIEHAVTPTVERAMALKDRFVATLAHTQPKEGETLVLRLKRGKDVSLNEALDAALAKAGIAAIGADSRTAAMQWQDAYRQNLEAKYAGKTSPGELLANSTVTATEAIFVEAPLERLEGIFDALSSGVSQPLSLNAIGKLALANGPSSRDPGAEGEGGSRQTFAQKLNASLFRLEREAVKATGNAPPAAVTLGPQQFVRVLILVEASE